VPPTPRITERYEIRRALKRVESYKDMLQTPLRGSSSRRAVEEDKGREQCGTRVQERAWGGHLAGGHYHIAPIRSDVQRSQRRQPEPYPSVQGHSAQSPPESARGEWGDAGHRSAVKEPLSGDRRYRLVRYQNVQADVTKRGGPAQASPHSRSLQTLASPRRHTSDPVPQPVVVASRAFAPSPGGSPCPQAYAHAMPRHDSSVLGRAGDTALF
jgi:hypothetical protein